MQGTGRNPIGNLAKLSPPKLGKVYQRQRLFECLDIARTKQQAVWISAPGGSGKTTLVASYAESRHLPLLWYQIDEGDGDIASFFHYLGSAVQPFASADDKPLPALMPEYLAGLPVFTRNFFRQLFAALPRPCVMVFDNYQDAPQHAQLHELLPLTLAEVPAGITLVIVSRVDPVPAYSRLVVNRSLNIIGWDQLQLTEDESLGIARKRLGKDKISAAILKSCHRQTQGWAAGLLLMLEQHGGAEWEGSNSPVVSQHALFDYFAGELFDKADTEIQQLLLGTAYLSKIDVKAAQALTGIASAGELLEALTRRNYFTVRLQAHPPVYEYHPLFREFLIACATRRFAHDKLNQLQQTTAELLAQAGYIAEAVMLLGQAEDWSTLGQLIRANARELVVQGKFQTLQHWIAQLPDVVVEQTPWLLYWRAVSLQPYDLDLSRQCYEKAYTDFKADEDVAGLYLAWAGYVDTFLFIWDDFLPLDRWIKEMETLRIQYPEYPSLDIEARVVFDMFGALIMRQPNHPQMGNWEARASQMLSEDIDSNYRILLGAYLLFNATWWRGDLARAKLYLDAVSPLVEREELGLLAQLQWRVMESTYCTCVNEFERCINAVKAGIKLGEQNGVVMMNFILNVQAAYACLTAGDFDEAVVYLEKCAAWRSPNATADAAHFHLLGAWVRLCRGEINEARVHAEMAIDKSEACHFVHAPSWAWHTRAHVHIRREEFTEALSLLARSLATGQELGNGNTVFQCLLSQAYIYKRTGEHQLACEALQQAFALGRERSYVFHPWIGWCHDIMVELYAFALAHDIEVAYVQQLIRLRQIVPAEPPLHLSNWPWALQIHTFGGLHIDKQGEPLRFSGKAQKKNLELLKAIIASGGSRVRAEHLAELLWPDADGDAAYQALTSAVYRLRKLIGHDSVDFQEGQIGLNSSVVWLDSWRLAHKLSDKAIEQQTLDRLEQSLGEVLSMYGGAFLLGEEAYWVLEPRERWRNRVLHYVAKGVARLRKAGRNEKVVVVCSKGLEIDPLAEVFYQEQMAAYLAMGQAAEAMKVYERCYKALHAGLGVMPSPKTEALRRELIKES